MPETTTKTVVGKIGGVGSANEHGFVNIKVETASGDVWLSTKTPGLIGTARDARGELRSIDYVEKVSDKISPKTGQPYVNRYLEAVRLPAQDEVNGSDVAGAVIPGVNAQTVPTVPVNTTLDNLGNEIPSPDFARANQEFAASSPQTSSPTQDDFRRSKEEMRYTEALKVAATLLAPQGAGTTALAVIADEIYDLIAAGKA